VRASQTPSRTFQEIFEEEGTARLRTDRPGSLRNRAFEAAGRLDYPLKGAPAVE
jgi:hypothetical protein